MARAANPETTQGAAGAGASGPWRLARALRRRPAFVLALLVLLLLLLAAVAPAWLAPYPPEAGDLDQRLAPPSAGHLLGTDQVGRDILTLLIHGARGSVVLAAGAVLLGQSLAVLAGVSGGYAGGWWDSLVQRLVDLWVALPGLLFLIVVLGTVGPSATAVLLALAALLFAGSVRMVRGATLVLRGSGELTAARSLGAGPLRLLLHHLLPSLLPLIAIQASLQLGTAVLLLSSLAFLGYGPPPPDPSWGRMLADARGDLTQPGGFNLALWPGLAITLSVYAFTVAGDAIHDLMLPERPR